MTIRRITLDDFPDCFAIADASYGLIYDKTAMWKWAIHAIHSPTVIGVKSENAFGFANAASVVWNPSEVHGSQLFLAVRNKAVWEAVKIVRTMAEWCIEVMGAEDYHFGEMTGMRMDIIAKRVGAVPNSPTFVVRRG